MYVSSTSCKIDDAPPVMTVEPPIGPCGWSTPTEPTGMFIESLTVLGEDLKSSKRAGSNITEYPIVFGMISPFALISARRIRIVLCHSLSSARAVPRRSATAHTCKLALGWKNHFFETVTFWGGGGGSAGGAAAGSDAGDIAAVGVTIVTGSGVGAGGGGGGGDGATSG